jgi:hypothetical protein
MLYTDPKSAVAFPFDSRQGRVRSVMSVNGQATKEQAMDEPGCSLIPVYLVGSLPPSCQVCRTLP